jgi:hypothetical protein
MHKGEPRVRRRGFFLHSDTTGEREAGELENPEGFVVRVGMVRAPVPRRMSSSGGRAQAASRSDEVRSQLRSENATGSRQRAGLHR